jgi:hypothetical protein
LKKEVALLLENGETGNGKEVTSISIRRTAFWCLNGTENNNVHDHFVAKIDGCRIYDALGTAIARVEI